MNKKAYIIKSFLTASSMFLSIKASKAMDELNQDIETFRNSLSAKIILDTANGNYVLNDSLHSRCDIFKFKENRLSLSKFFFDNMIFHENYSTAFNSPKISQESVPIIYFTAYASKWHYCNIPQHHIDEVKNNINIYIREQSLLIFEKLLSDSLYAKAYNFSIAYRDVFSGVDPEHGETIRNTAIAWIEQIKTKASVQLILLGQTYRALEYYGNLADPILRQAEAIVNPFPREDNLRTLLWSVFANARKAFQKQSVEEEAINESIRLSFKDYLS